MAQFRPHVVASGTVLAVAWAISTLGLPRPTDASDIDLLQAYLDANCDDELGLYREAPNVAPDVFGVYSDGLRQGDKREISLAQIFLLAMYDPTLGLFRASPVIEKDNYWIWGDAYIAGANISQWDVPEITRWKVLKGSIVPEQELLLGEVPIDVDVSRGVKTHVNDGVVFDDITIFADRLAMAVINAHNAEIFKGNKNF